MILNDSNIYDLFYFIVLIINVIAIFFPIILVIIFIFKEKKKNIFSFLDFYLYLGCIFHSACYFVPPFDFNPKFDAYTKIGGRIQGVLAMSIILFALTLLVCISYVTYTNFTNPTFIMNNKKLYIISIHCFIFGIPIIFIIGMFAANAKIVVGISRYCWGNGGGVEIPFYSLIFILYIISLVYIIKLKNSVGVFINNCGNDVSFESQVKTVKHYYLMIIFSIFVFIIEIARLIFSWATGDEDDETTNTFYGTVVIIGDIVEQIMFPVFVFIFGFTETRFEYFKELIFCQKSSEILINIEDGNQINLVEKKEVDEEEDDVEVVEHEDD